jgi:hypothetical protein
MRSHAETGDSATKLAHFALAIAPGSIIFAAAMSGQGVLALVYGDFASPWQPVPQWLPWRQGVAYLSGVVMLAGGLVHAPSLFATPPPEWATTVRLQWTALFWASALAGSAWIVARSLRDRPWGARV